MRIVYINSVVDFGSTGTLVRALANHEKSLGHEVLICYGRNEISDDAECFYFGNTVSTLFHLGMTRVFGRNGLHSKRQTQRLLERIDAFQPDLVHLHNIHGYYLHVPMLFDYLKRKKLKVVWTLHDCWAVSGSSAHFDYHGCALFDEGCVVCNSTKDYPTVIGIKRQRKNFAYKRSAFTSLAAQDMTLITPSYWLKQLIQTTFLNKYRVETIYNGISLDTFHAGKKEPHDAIELLGVANAWETRKGLDDFVALAESLPAGYRLTLVGLTQKQADALPPSIRGIVRTRNVQELVALYQNSDIYLNLSYEETMGMTTVEALACGTPCIVYDRTAVPEVLDETCGVVVKAGDLAALLQAIRSFDFERYTGERCLRRAQEFPLEKMLKSYEKELEDLYEK